MADKTGKFTDDPSNTSIQSNNGDDYDFPIIGIGASAGGLAAFEAFFASMQSFTDIKIAIILIQHLAPDHKSILTEIIQRYTSMKVFEVEDEMPIRMGYTYIIPPNKDMALYNGTLRLMEPVKVHGQLLPIDFFFRSLAQERRDRAITIILSGTGKDGTLGAEKIKDEGGVVIVQRPESAEFDGMPNSVIASGLADYVLSPEEMPEQIIDHVLRTIDNTTDHRMLTKKHSTLKKIFFLLHDKTGHDFTMYKPTTIRRRIERRMDVHQIETIDEYIRYLQQKDDEIDALFKDLLIGVTNFFRDSEAFTVLEKKVIPGLFTDRPDGSPVRIWVPGCSTGEEAYSIAILIREYLDDHNQSHPVQIFASDIDSEAISKARSGLYPASITIDIAPERIQHFFTSEHDSTMYRVNKSIRDMLVFSEHNIIKDPPFSKLDMISCRNLMIYMNVDLQKKVLPLFHYALYPQGILFLGSSETIGSLTALFSVLDQKAKLFRRKDTIQREWQITPSHLLPTKRAYTTYSRTDSKGPQALSLPLQELTEQAILQQIAPAAALVNEQGDILYLHGRTGMYLELPSGESGINNILTMAREGLRHELSLALQKAKKESKTIYVKDIHVNTNGHHTTVDLTIRMVTLSSAFTPQHPLYLILLDSLSPVEQQQQLKTEQTRRRVEAGNKTEHPQNIESLKRELHIQRQFLQDANERLALSNEELKSFNEEMQSMNEELQSTNEELETSREELESVNEELSTVNAELQDKVTDLSHSNNDMNNLLAGTGIGTVFVDHALCIMRFTPAVTRIINLIDSDMGRPIEHIVSNLAEYDTLITDIKAVLETLIPKELEVRTNDGRWFQMRVQPYRTLEHVIKGAVISFVDITESVKMRGELSHMHTSLSTIVHNANDAITMHAMDGKTLTWNPTAERLYGWSEDEALKMNVEERIPPSRQHEDILKLEQLSKAEVLKPYATQRLSKKGDTIDITITATALLDEEGKVYAISTTERPLKDLR